jgi:hypothetical protein
MIVVGEHGSKDCLPWVRAELAPGRWPGQWWWEICYYDPEIETWQEGPVFPGWVHDWERDGSCFGLWRAVRKAALAADDCWWEEFEKQHPELQERVDAFLNEMDEKTDEDQ